jgi:hypothetical protein
MYHIESILRFLAHEKRSLVGVVSAFKPSFFCTHCPYGIMLERYHNAKGQKAIVTMLPTKQIARK